MDVANIYDNGPISPIARIKDNLSIWSEQKWMNFQIEYIEPVPRSAPMVVDMVLLNNATVIAANATIAKMVVPILQMNNGEMLQLRWEPMDDVEGMLWELSGQARFNPRGAHARVDQMTRLYDPYLATTSFYILGGQNKDMNLEVRNPLPVAQPTARFAFWGFRYILTLLPNMPMKTTYLPAQGR